MVGNTNDLARLDASRLLLQRQSSERHWHGLFISGPGLLKLDGRQGTLLGSPAVCLFLAVCKVRVEVDAVAANFVLVIVPTLVAGPILQGTCPIASSLAAPPGARCRLRGSGQSGPSPPQASYATYLTAGPCPASTLCPECPCTEGRCKRLRPLGALHGELHLPE